ncbi:MAG: hypothetical protein Q8N05_09505 [Bacteroidota bacterium]|nr:hypothetical protein [Bacteroidota bacterium]
MIESFMKESLNKGDEPQLTFWRDKTGNEVDLLRTIGSKQNAYEIKSGETFSFGHFKGISYWSKLSGATSDSCFAIYTGSKPIKTSYGDVISWLDF